MADYPVPGAGVFPSQWLRRAIDDGLIHWKEGTLDAPAVQPASLDLHLGDVAYRLRCSFLPDTTHTVEERMEEFVMGEVDLRGGAVLERNRPYLIPLVERLDLPTNVRAKANPKSSTGRIDVFTRVISDHSHRFDEINAGYSGQLYLEVISSTFTIKVHPGLTLNQLRLVAGKSTLADKEVAALHDSVGLLFDGKQKVSPNDFIYEGGVYLGLDLTGADNGGVVGYRAKRNSQLLDLARVGEHPADEYWEPVVRERGDQIVLEPEVFYLLLSAEGISIPPNVAGEMVAFDPTSGELRTHYAGFFDPGFGWDPYGMPGSRAALEVRAHDVPFMVQNRLRVVRIAYEPLVEPAEELYGAGIGSNYQGQVSTLSKYFKQ